MRTQVKLFFNPIHLCGNTWQGTLHLNFKTILQRRYYNDVYLTDEKTEVCKG